ncbi:hypothetical protein GIB67_036869 [Kingdonia uniflora]|uniref:Uncharacterized protein n=1 Tax=Kingdonia uniflora TaxID=39325 RepID=A0A7J7LX97_9MAGN|nr:hypothetical protein GIB67_036869 [Kingdonia uniflora]
MVVAYRRSYKGSGLPISDPSLWEKDGNGHSGKVPFPYYLFSRIIMVTLVKSPSPTINFSG